MSTWPVLVLGIYLVYLVYLSTWSTVLDLNPEYDIGKFNHSMSNHQMVETVPPQILMKIYTFGLYGQKRRFAKY